MLKCTHTHTHIHTRGGGRRGEREGEGEEGREGGRTVAVSSVYLLGPAPGKGTPLDKLGLWPTQLKIRCSKLGEQIGSNLK